MKKLEKYIQVVCKLFRFKEATKLEIENIRDSSQVSLTRKHRLFSHTNQSSGFTASKFEHTFRYNLLAKKNNLKSIVLSKQKKSFFLLLLFMSIQ